MLFSTDVVENSLKGQRYAVIAGALREGFTG